MKPIEVALFASIGVGLLVGLAAAVVVARVIRGRWRVAGAIVDAEAEAADRRSTFADEMDRHGIEDQPPSAPPVGPAAGRASVDDNADTQVFTVHQSKHAAPEPDELHVGIASWTGADRRRTNAAEGRF